MIKCNVSVCGIIKGCPTVRTAKEGGGKFITFCLGVVIPAKSGDNKPIDISVSIDGTESDLSKYAESTRVEVAGTLTLRKKDTNLYFNLRASSVTETDKEDSVKGTMTFRGTVGKTVDERKDKKGRDYYNFSAFSTEKNGETYSFLWVRFVRFNAKREGWLQPGTGIDASGDLEVSAYNGNVNLGCRITDIAVWDKTANTQQVTETKEEDPNNLPF